MRLIDFIIAEDIRLEMGNKISVMGILGDNMTISPIPPAWPIPMRIGVFIRVLVEDIDQIPNKFSIKISLGDDKIARMEGQIASTERIGLLTLPLAINPLPIPGPGLLELNFALLSGDEILLAEQSNITIEVK